MQKFQSDNISSDAVIHIYIPQMYIFLKAKHGLIETDIDQNFCLDSYIHIYDVLAKQLTELQNEIVFILLNH